VHYLQTNYTNRLYPLASGSTQENMRKRASLRKARFGLVLVQGLTYHNARVADVEHHNNWCSVQQYMLTV
jgi:hypothetical protein